MGIIALVSGVRVWQRMEQVYKAAIQTYATEDQAARKSAPSRVARRQQTWMSHMDVTHYLDYWNLVKNNHCFIM